MKKIYLSLWMMFLSLGLATQAWAQDRSFVKLATSKEYGENLTIYPKTASKEETIYVDWGDGEEKAYNIDPNGMPFFSKVSGKLLSDTIYIYANLVSLDCTESQITYLEAVDQPKMQRLLANANALTSDNLILEGAANLENLDLSDNNLGLLNLSEFQELQMFSANNNPNLGAVMFPEYSEALKSVSLSKCDISRFNPVELPVLSSLNLSECALMDIEIGNHYPALETLDVSGNYISKIDVSTCKKLHTLKCGNNQLSEINISQNPEMLNFYCEHNHIKELNVKNNPKITNLSCDYNELTHLNVTYLPTLYRLACDNNQLTRLDLSHNPSLNRLTCKDNQLEFLDFSGNPSVDYIDCRNNSRMTSNTVNFMFSTLLARYRDAWTPNLLVEGCNAEHADMSEVNSSDMKWKTDITGDGTAQSVSVSLTALPAQNGSYVLSQSKQFGRDYQTITDQAKTGVPVKLTATADEGFLFDYAKVNGTVVNDSLFVIEEAAQVEVYFKSNQHPTMTLTVVPSAELSFALSAPQDGTTITIDWGDGVESTYELGKSLKRFDSMAAGTTLVIKGDINEADFSSYPGMGMWDNQFSSLTLSYCDNLESLITYMNPIQTLDVSQCPNLQILDCSYSDLTSLNVTQNKELVSLQCYGNAISTLDVTQCTNLVELNAKANQLSTLDLTANSKLEYLDVQNNKLKSIDVKHMKALAQLYVSLNELTELDVTQNEDLYILNAQQNLLKSLDLSHNLALGKLLIADNQIATLDLSAQEYVFYVDCSGNKMTAEALTDLYYSLPEYPELVTPLKGFTLWVKGLNPETANDAERAESILATGKGWAINYEGDGSGCTTAYVTILPSQNGSVEVFTADGTAVLSGTKVAKETELTVKANPEAGYEVSRLTANGKEVVDGKFTITRSTDVAARFAVSTGLDEIETTEGSCLVVGGNCIVKISTDQPVEVSVYALNGKLVKQETLEQDGSVSVPSGTYVVKTVTGKTAESKVIIVR